VGRDRCAHHRANKDGEGVDQRGGRGDPDQDG
jgi:hypothetical protein